MGYLLVMGPCVGCSRVFSFNPHRVPSIIVDGERQPVCRNCVERTNPIRAAKGLDTFTIQPGAYEPISESEI